jgi:hypothetical protein
MFISTLFSNTLSLFSSLSYATLTVLSKEYQ